MTTPTHDTDFYAWTQAQATALRAKDLANDEDFWPDMEDALAKESTAAAAGCL